MTLLVNKDGSMTLVQGDSGKFGVVNLSTDKDYKVYFAIQDKNRKPVGSEISVNAFTGSAPNTTRMDSVEFSITQSLTNLLTVPKGQETEEYYYGIKLCEVSSNTEDTAVINDGDIGDVNTITVYPKKVEGI